MTGPGGVSLGWRYDHIRNLDGWFLQPHLKIFLANRLELHSLYEYSSESTDSVAVKHSAYRACCVSIFNRGGYDHDSKTRYPFTGNAAKTGNLFAENTPNRDISAVFWDLGFSLPINFLWGPL